MTVLDDAVAGWMAGMSVEALQSWPSRLPLPEVQGYNLAKGQVFTRSDPSDGPARYRMDRRYPSDLVRCSLILQQKEIRGFNWFFYDFLNLGTYWFWMPLILEYQVMWYVVHFTEAPAFDLQVGTGTWGTSFSLEVDSTIAPSPTNPNASGAVEDGFVFTDNPVDLIEFLPNDIVAPQSAAALMSSPYVYHDNVRGPPVP